MTDGAVSKEQLEEAKQLANEFPTADAQYAVALMLRAAGDSTGYVAQLQRTADALGNSAWDRYPRLFDLYASRGDVEGMKRLAKSAKDPLLEAKILKAERKAEQAIALLAPLGDSSAEVVALRASLQLDAGKLNDAILSFTKALSMKKDPEIQHGLGVAYLERGLSELAVESLLAATTADPKNARYVSNLAAAYANLDKKEDALKHLFGALSSSPDDPGST